MSDVYEQWCLCGRSFYGTDRDRGSGCAQCRRRRGIAPLFESGRVFLTGTPWSHDSYLGNKHMSLKTESREHIDVMEYTAQWHHRCGMYKTEILGGCEKQRGHAGNCAGPAMYGMDRGMPIYDFPCSCGRTIRGTDRDRGKQCTHATQQPPTLRKWLGNHVAELGRWADRLRERPVTAGTLSDWEWRQFGNRWLLGAKLRRPNGEVADATFAPETLVWYFTSANDEGWRATLEMALFTRRSPTLREWLGDRVSELGRWADVLREQPVPAGWIVRLEWTPYGGLNAIDENGGINCVGVETVMSAILSNWNVGRAEAYQMALFTRHPDVKPAPKPAAFPWDPYPEVV